MANISIYDLRPAGADLFDDSENYLQELTDIEFSETNGGGTPLVAVAILTVVVLVVVPVYATIAAGPPK